MQKCTIVISTLLSIVSAAEELKKGNELSLVGFAASSNLHLMSMRSYQAFEDGFSLDARVENSLYIVHIL